MVTVSHRFGEGPCLSSRQPTPFVIFEKCWKRRVGNQV